jgi:hypothetical protein
MDDLTAQERELIMTFRRLSRLTVIVHRKAYRSATTASAVRRRSPPATPRSSGSTRREGSSPLRPRSFRWLGLARRSPHCANAAPAAPPYTCAMTERIAEWRPDAHPVAPYAHALRP